MNIDCHAHFIPPAMLADLQANPKRFPSVAWTMQDGKMCFSFAGGNPKRPLMPGFSNVEARRKWVAEQRIDRQIVAGWLDMFGYDIPAEEGADWACYLNEEMLRGVRELPFLVPLATVPMQSGKHAAAVLREALAAGCHGAMIGTQPKGASGVLDDPDLDPFWEAASDLGATLFVHPTFGARDDRLKQYGLVSAVGRVTDTSIAVARLLYSGHLMRYPNVKLVLSHGGAALPMLLGRLKRSFATAPADNFDPEPAFRKLYFDSVVYDAATLRFVAELAGTDKIMMGTDHPFSIGEPEPLGFIESCGFTPEQRAGIVGGTARAIFKI